MNDTVSLKKRGERRWKQRQQALKPRGRKNGSAQAAKTNCWSRKALVLRSASWWWPGCP